MRNFIVMLCAAFILVSCSGKSSSPDADSKDARNQRSIDQMDRAMDELDSGSAPQPDASAVGSGSYNRTLNEAEKAQRELACASGNKSEEDCLVDSQMLTPPVPPDTPAVEEKSRPTTIREGAAPIKTTQYPIVDGYPIWFNQPGYDDYLGGVGVAKKQSGGYAVQRRVAITLAQADLARSIKVNVNNEYTSERLLVDKKTQSYYKEKFSTMSNQQADEYIKNPQVMDEWLDEKTGELYIWVVLPR